ncbi:hypothetical protein [Pararhizobium sp. LjRoot238]|uniref:hypothetical protein n=1 Tax=Pararhizobium sp. LjRoot238 TaxID=3342293 RepID=UPI003ECF93AE
MTRSRQMAGVVAATAPQNLRTLAAARDEERGLHQPFDFHDGFLTNLYPIWGMHDSLFHSLLPGLDTLQPGNFIT